MVYRKEIPQATERPSVSQPKIKENFTQINDQFGVDHTELEASSNLGKHKKVTLYEQADDQETLANEAVIYAKEGDNGTALYYRGENNGDVSRFGLSVLAFASTNRSGALINDRFNIDNVAVRKGVTSPNQTYYDFTFANELSDTSYLVSVTMVNPSRIGSIFVSPKSTTILTIVFDALGLPSIGTGDTGLDLIVYKV